jgi:tetratricopeptide (TPR) repeat protein
VPVVARPPLRISERAPEGDARRRASLQLVLDGLTEEVLGHPQTALSRYDDALKLDPNNPYVALALARHEIFAGDPDRGLAQLDRYEALESRDVLALAHVAGLRGAALARLGQSALARPYLEEARTLAPGVWGDARLDARELR